MRHLEIEPKSSSSTEFDANQSESTAMASGVESSDEDEPDDMSKNVRRNRRKSVAPQRAIQRQHSEPEQNLAIDLDLIGLDDANLDGTLLQEELLCDIDEHGIFKDLKEEAEGEKLDIDVLENVKEEWRAHWGIKCNMCELVIAHKIDFDRHYRECYALVPVYTCTFCNKTSDKYSTFRSHCYRHITEGRYKCQDCPKGFSLQSMLHVHTLAKHTKSKPYTCCECGKCFVTRAGLKVHCKKHKGEQKEEYPCAECGKILHTRGGLTSHMNVHRLGRRFMCDVCGKTFTQKVNMQQHVKQHTGDKPYGCDKCGKTFAERSHLARHYSFHTDQRPFKCDVCQKMYKTERCLKVHGLVHSTARPFVCTYCNKGFLSSTKLKQHHNIHTGERPYKCKYCERTFTNYPNWLKHTRRRHKVDHKTGQNLTNQQQPQEPVNNSQEVKEELANSADQLMADITLSKSDELALQQGLGGDFPLSDEMALLQQQQSLVDFIGGNNATFMQYFPGPSQNLVQSTNNAVLPPVQIQFNDLVQSQYLQQQPLI